MKGVCNGRKRITKNYYNNSNKFGFIITCKCSYLLYNWWEIVMTQQKTIGADFI